MTKNNSMRTCCPSRVAVAARVGPVASAARVGPVPFRLVPFRPALGTLCNYKAKAGKVSERDEERVGPVPSLTVSKHVAFASHRILCLNAGSVRRCPVAMVGA